MLKRAISGTAVLVASLLTTSSFADEIEGNETKNSRFEAALGIGHLDIDVELDGYGEFNGVGGGGVRTGFRYWYDSQPNYSLGLEYGYLRNSISGSYNGSGNKGSGSADIDIHILSLNGVLRKNQGSEHPYIGAGIGLANMKFSGSGISYSYSNASQGYVPDNTLNENRQETAPFIQVIAGYDFDIDESMYVGLETKYLYVPVELVDSDAKFRDLAAVLKVGYKF